MVNRRTFEGLSPLKMVIAEQNHAGFVGCCAARLQA